MKRDKWPSFVMCRVENLEGNVNIPLNFFFKIWTNYYTKKNLNKFPQITDFTINALKKKFKVKTFGKEMPTFSPISIFKKKELLKEYLNEFQP